MSDSIEPAVVDLDDLCDACRARVSQVTPTKRKKGPGEHIGSFVGGLVLLWLVLAVLGILTLVLLHLAGVMH